MRIVLALSMCSCGNDLLTIDLSDRTDVVAFAVTFDGDLGVLRTSDPFRVVNGSIVFGKRPELVLGADESSAALVEIDWPAFASTLPALDASRLAEMRTRSMAPPPSPELSYDDPRRAFSRRPLPLGSIEVEGADDGVVSAVLLGVTLEVPVDPEWCRPTERAFEPFGGTSRPIPEASLLELQFRSVVRIGDYAVILGPTRAHLLERGDFIDGASDTVDFPSILGPSAVGQTVEVDIRPDGRVVTAASVTQDTTAIVELRIDTSSLTYVRTTSVVASKLTNLSVSADGRAAFSASEARVYVEKDGVLESFLLDAPGLGARAQGIEWTGDPDHPLVTSTRNQMHLFDAASGRFERMPLPLRVDVELVNLDGMDAAEGVVWGVGSESYIVRLTSEESGFVDLDLPPRSLLCSTSGDPSAMKEGLLAVAIMDGFVYMLRESCNSVIAVRLEDRCVSLLPVEGEPRVLAHEVEGLMDLHASEGVIVVVGRAGRVYRLEL